MQRTLLVRSAAFAIALAGLAGLAYGQPEPAGKPLMGKVTLYDGRTFEGDIQFAEFGVIGDGDGVGSRMPEGGSMRIVVGEEKVTVPASEIASIEAKWENKGDEAKADWQIEQITIVKRDGSTLIGKPDWKLPASSLRIVTAEGEQPTRIHAFPLGRTFDEKNLLVKVELTGEAAEAPAAPAPAPPTPGPEKPAEAEKPGEAEKPSAEGVPAPKPAVAPKPPAAPPVPAAPKPEVTKPSEATPGGASTVAPAAPRGPAAPTAAAPTPIGLTLTIVCPHCGKPMTIDLAAWLRGASATSAVGSAPAKPEEGTK
ncbi:MAG: hypothetical protein ACE5O2_10540 [Armatimonadota bacterium]